MRIAAVLLLLSCLAFAGCFGIGGGKGKDGSGSSSTTTAPDQDPAYDPCKTVTATTTVPTWTKHGGQWGEVAALEGRDGVVCGKAEGALNGLTSDFSGPFGDVEVNVGFVMLSGTFGTTAAEANKTNAGAGIVLHYASDKDYNIVRYSPREQDWHLFTVINGTRTKETNGTVVGNNNDPVFAEWIDLRVRSEGGHVTAFNGNTKTIDFELPASASHNGRVGYFLRDKGMVAAYDGFTVLPLV